MLSTNETTQKQIQTRPTPQILRLCTFSKNLKEIMSRGKNRQTKQKKKRGQQQNEKTGVIITPRFPSFYFRTLQSLSHPHLLYMQVIQQLILVCVSSIYLLITRSPFFAKVGA